jgi:hypothetical protein
MDPRTKEDIDNERLRVDQEFEKYVDETGDLSGGDQWRCAAYDELDWEEKHLSKGN